MIHEQVIATELLKGQGLGNQLFCYVTTRCLAMKNHSQFAILNKEILANNMHSNKGMYFMDIDCGLDMKKEEFSEIYQEKEDRIYLGNSIHDIEHGCYISGADEKLLRLAQSTLVYGNMQDEAYFGQYKEEIKQWLRVKPEYDSYEYSRDNLCIINIRGGEYTSNPELFLRRKYWLDAMKVMKRKRPDIEFMVITDDLSAARRILPEVPAYHFDLSGDYTAIKNAKYLILSNSTFAFSLLIPVKLFSILLHRNIGRDIMCRMDIGHLSRIFMMSSYIWIERENFLLQQNVGKSWQHISRVPTDIKRLE